MIPSDTPVVRALRSAASRRWDDDRGGSHVLGVILIVAIVLTGIVAIVGFGVTGLADSTSDVSATAVERDLTGFAQAVDRATVHSDTAAGTTTVDLAFAEVADSREQVRLDESAGELTLHTRANGVEQTLANTSLGLVEYVGPRGSRVAYQAGLVFAAPDASATPAVVRTNAFTHRTDGGVAGLTLHITQVTGQTTLDRQIEVSAGDTEDLHPDILVGTGGAGADELVLRVDSTYSAGWELALRNTFPTARTEVTHSGTELEVVYDVPEEGMVLHAYHHEVELGGR